MDVELLIGSGDLCGESPLWDREQARLLWVDIEQSVVYSWSPGAATREMVHVGINVAGLGLARDGGLVMGGSDGLWLRSASGELQPLVTEFDGLPLSINDLVVDRAGRIFLGTAYWDVEGKMERAGALYRYDPDGRLHVLEARLELANGMGLSPDNSTFYLTDSTARVIYAYDYFTDTGDIRNRRPFVQVPPDEGIPDGLTVDHEGGVWSAHWYGGEAVRYTPQGTVDQRISLPVKQVSSVGFGGSDYHTLFITSAASPWRSHYAPPHFDYSADMGGGLYTARVAFQGIPEPFADIG